MSKQILTMIELVANEKELDKEQILQAVESSLASATEKTHGKKLKAKVKIDRDTGDYETYRVWEVVDFDSERFDEEPFYAEWMLTLPKAQEINPDIQVGEYIEEKMNSVDFGRIAAQQGKSFILKAVRHAELALMADRYSERVGEMVMATVKGVYHGQQKAVVSLGNADAELSKEDQIMREQLEMNQRIRVCISDVARPEGAAPVIHVSRIAPDLVKELFKLEVPEITEGLIQIMSVAREPGIRAKVAVKTNDKRIDPVGACVGMRGARVQQVSENLDGERIEIVKFDADPAQFVINALAPAEITSIVVNEETRSMDIAVADDMLAQAIGKAGQNVRLASELTGWTLNVMSEADFDAKQLEETSHYLEMFKDKLNVDNDVAALLVSEGLSSLEELAYLPLEEMTKIIPDESTIELLQNRAKDALLEQAIMGPSLDGVEDDLRNLEGMDDDVLASLSEGGVKSLEDLAEKSIDDVLDVNSALDKDKVGGLIMLAREKCWFNE